MGRPYILPKIILHVFTFVFVLSVRFTNTQWGYMMRRKRTEAIGLSEMKEKVPGCCTQTGPRTKERSPEEVKRLMNRLNRIEGQIRGIKGMVERSAYCPDILVQCSAVTAAMNAFNRELLAAHIRGCVANDIKNGDESALDELVATIQKLMR